MSLIQFQKVLAYLCANTNFRRLFFMHPDIILKDFALTPKERHSLKSLDRNKVSFYATSLISKRFKKVKNAFLLIANVIGKESLVKLFTLYSQLNYPNIFSRREEIERFAEFISQELLASQEIPPYIPDLIKFERTYFLVSVGLLNDLEDEEL